jgi:hypothetical protein
MSSVGLGNGIVSPPVTRSVLGGTYYSSGRRQADRLSLSVCFYSFRLWLY